MVTRFKFVPQTAKLADGRRRKRFRTACNHCRVRKRRCSHQPQCSATLAAASANKEPVPQFLEPVTARAYDIRNQDIDGQSSSHKVATTNQAIVTHTTNKPCEKQTFASMPAYTAMAQAQPSRQWDMLNGSFGLDSWQPLAESSHQVLCWKRSAASHTTSMLSPPDTSSTTPLQPPVCSTPPSSIGAILAGTPGYVQDNNSEVQLLDDGMFGETICEIFPDAISDWLHQSVSTMCTVAQGYPSSETQHQHQCLTPSSSSSSCSSSWSGSVTNMLEIVSRGTDMALSEVYFETVRTMPYMLNETEYGQSLAPGPLPGPSIGVPFDISSTDLSDAQDIAVNGEYFSGVSWGSNTGNAFGKIGDISWMYLGGDNDIDFNLTNCHDFDLDEAWQTKPQA